MMTKQKKEILLSKLTNIKNQIDTSELCEDISCSRCSLNNFFEDNKCHMAIINDILSDAIKILSKTQTKPKICPICGQEVKK